MLAQSEAQARHAVPFGLVRVSAPAAFGQIVLAPLLFSFMAEHPAVRLDLRLADERVPLIANGIDLAIRMGPLEDSELVARRIAVMPMRIVASAEYLSMHGEPLAPAALVDHRTILTRPDLDQWQIDGRAIRLRWSLSTGSMLVTRDALVKGLGIGMLPAFLADPAIRAGQLKRLLPGCALSGGDISALWPRSQIPSLAVSSLVDHLLRARPGCTDTMPSDLQARTQP